MYYGSKAKTGKGTRDPISRGNKVVVRVTRIEIANILENFKADILSTLSNQLDALQTKKIQDEQNVALSILCSKCRKKHSVKYCPLKNV